MLVASRGKFQLRHHISTIQIIVVFTEHVTVESPRNAEPLIVSVNDDPPTRKINGSKQQRGLPSVGLVYNKLTVERVHHCQ